MKKTVKGGKDKGWKQRYLILTQDSLEYYDKKKKSAPLLVVGPPPAFCLNCGAGDVACRVPGERSNMWRHSRGGASCKRAEQTHWCAPDTPVLERWWCRRGAVHRIRRRGTVLILEKGTRSRSGTCGWAASMQATSAGGRTTNPYVLHLVARVSALRKARTVGSSSGGQTQSTEREVLSESKTRSMPT